MANNDLFGFDELNGALENIIEKCRTGGDRLLHDKGKLAVQKARELSPETSEKSAKKNKVARTKKGQLKKSWEVQSPKDYKNGNVKVVRILSTAPHSHLIDQGHNIVTTHGRKTGKIAKISRADRKVLNVKTKGRTKAEEIRKKSIDSVKDEFFADAENLIDDIFKEFE